MRSIAIAIIVILLIGILAVVFASFRVRETECALVTTFGEPGRQLTEPGWYPRWPFPIQKVYKFDSRMMDFEVDAAEVTTQGAVPIIVKTYIVWRIAKPLEFFTSVGSIEQAERRLSNQIYDMQSRIVGQHAFAEFVSSNPEQIKFRDIEAEMLADLQQSVSQAYGIEIKALGMKQLKVNQDVSKDVFERMRAERNRRTEKTIAQGNAEATKIRSDADAKKKELLAAAEARATAIRARGDAEAAQYYSLLDEAPDLAIFLRETEAIRKILKKRTSIVISADAEPFRLLKEMPDVKAPEPNEPGK